MVTGKLRLVFKCYVWLVFQKVQDFSHLSKK